MMRRYLCAVLLVVVLLLGCGETPTEPEPDRPEQNPEPEVVVYRATQEAAMDTHLLQCSEADSLIVQEPRTSAENGCK